MPAKPTVQYRGAEARFRAARTLDDRRLALEEMLASLPKQEGTERIELDIKRRLARLRFEVERRALKRGMSHHVDFEGAAQVVLLGAPSSGKSALLGAVTRAEPAVADYPFTTTRPQPGLMPFEDVQLQLVDLPAITAQHMSPWMPSLVQTADAALLLADPTAPGVLAGVEEVADRLADVHVPLVGCLPGAGDPQDLPLLTLLVIAKADLARDQDMEVIEELYADRFPTVRLSAVSRVGLQAMKVALWKLLQLVRVYNKPSGKKAERTDPFVLPQGSTVLDLAARVHAELPDRLAFARVWGGKIEGQRVSRDFELRDRDVVELAT